MHTAAECDGIRIGTPGGEIAKLVGHGFVGISTAKWTGRHRQGHAGGAHLSASGLFEYDGVVSVNLDCNDWLFVRLRRVGRLKSTLPAESHINLHLDQEQLKVAKIADKAAALGRQGSRQAVMIGFVLSSPPDH